jgi:type IV pilus assembly protein PilE
MGKQRGFTLIEVMIALVIVAIIAAVGYPSYIEYTNRGKRAEGKSALLRAAQQLERYYTLNNCYPSPTPCAANATSSALALTAANIPASSSTDTSVPGKYAISVTFTPQAFTLTATPNYTDPKCGSFTLTNTNQKGLTGATDTVTNCWSK